jgi:hypothetical protein
MMNGTSQQDQFKGGAFVWFTGVVEDIADPMFMGRVRVRCFGFHSDDRAEIDTADLPWAVVMTPVTNAAMGGIGQSATGILRGTWVIGFFRDGPSAQDPIILGTLPSQTSMLPKDRGFNDPQDVYPLIGNEIDTPRQAREAFRETGSYSLRESTRQEKIETAIQPNLSTVDPSPVDETRSTWSNWKTEDVIQPAYPNNHVWHTRSGHTIEVDDTPGYERIAVLHKSGSYYETRGNGDHTVMTVGGRDTVVSKNDNVYVKGSANLTVDGTVRTLVKGSYHIEVEGDYTENIKGSKKTKVGGSELVEIFSDRSVNIGRNDILHVKENSTILIDDSSTTVVGGESSRTIQKSSTTHVMGDVVEYYKGSLSFTVGKGRTDNILESYVLNVKDDHKITVIRDLTTAVGRDTKTTTTVNSVTNVGGNSNLLIKGAKIDQITGAWTSTSSLATLNNNVQVNGSLTATTQVTADNIGLTTHKHPVGSSTTGPSVP